MSEKPSLNFETAKFTYDELEAQLRDFQPDPGRYPHDVPSIISVEEGIRAGRMGHEDLPDYGDAARPKTPEEGVDTPVWLATLSDDGPTGGFFTDRKRRDW